ncbi:MAG: hypothetical protein IPJ13_15370 [Saprospiraceae bacterium]|nr:hypothetical protein [Saprospiraceae bacterium]
MKRLISIFILLFLVGNSFAKNADFFGVREVVAAKTSTKMISQFSSSTIDDAVAYAMKNKVTHVFGKAAHNLDPLVTKIGGQENTFRAV